MGKRIEFETFRQVDPYLIGQMTQKEPSCFNGDVRVRKYRITVEEIDEPLETLHQRLRDLWDEANGPKGNHHHLRPIQIAAKKLGLTLSH